MLNCTALNMQLMQNKYKSKSWQAFWDIKQISTHLLHSHSYWISVDDWGAWRKWDIFRLVRKHQLDNPVSMGQLKTLVSYQGLKRILWYLIYSKYKIEFWTWAPRNIAVLLKFSAIKIMMGCNTHPMKYICGSNMIHEFTAMLPKVGHRCSSGDETLDGCYELKQDLSSWAPAVSNSLVWDPQFPGWPSADHQGNHVGMMNL